MSLYIGQVGYGNSIYYASAADGGGGAGKAKTLDASDDEPLGKSTTKNKDDRTVKKLFARVINRPISSARQQKLYVSIVSAADTAGRSLQSVGEKNAEFSAIKKSAGRIRSDYYRGKAYVVIAENMANAKLEEATSILGLAWETFGSITDTYERADGLVVVAQALIRIDPKATAINHLFDEAGTAAAAIADPQRRAEIYLKIASEIYEMKGDPAKIFGNLDKAQAAVQKMPAQDGQMKNAYLSKIHFTRSSVNARLSPVNPPEPAPAMEPATPPTGWSGFQMDKKQ